jgi:hypothetical protein
VHVDSARFRTLFAAHDAEAAAVAERIEGVLATPAHRGRRAFARAP